jgi:hypothetical protein
MSCLPLSSTSGPQLEKAVFNQCMTPSALVARARKPRGSAWLTSAAQAGRAASEGAAKSPGGRPLPRRGRRGKAGHRQRRCGEPRCSPGVGARDPRRGGSRPPDAAARGRRRVGQDQDPLPPVQGSRRGEAWGLAGDGGARGGQGRWRRRPCAQPRPPVLPWLGERERGRREMAEG